MSAADTNRIEEIKRQRLDLQFEMDSILDKYLGEDEGQWHRVGYWECPTSPIGVCVYHRMNDPHSDRCIYCGHPSERK